MRKTKLADILSSFTPNEIKEFEKFVASPFFSRTRDLRSFYKVVKSYYPAFNAPEFSYENVFRKLFPKETFNKLKSENLLRVMSAELVKLAEEFFIYTSSKKDKLKNRVILMNSLIERNLNKYFDKVFNDTMKELPVLKKDLTGFHFVDLYHLYMMDVASNYNNNRADKGLIEGQIYLLCFFLLCSATFIDNSSKRITNNNRNSGDDVILHFAKNFDFKKFISYLENRSGINKADKDILDLCIYEFAYSFDNNNVDFLKKLEAKFYECKHMFRLDHKFSFYALIHNYYGKNADTVKLNFMYKNMLSDIEKSPENKSFMAMILYRLIILNFVEMKQLKEAKAFIDNYTNALNTDKRDSFYNFGLALIEFRRNNYDKSLEYLSKVDLIFLFLHHDVRLLYLILYFELDYTDEAYSLLDTYLHFLKKNKNVSDRVRGNSRKFIDYYKQLVRAKTSGNYSNVNIIEKNLSLEKKLMFKFWLAEKIIQFKKKK